MTKLHPELIPHVGNTGAFHALTHPLLYAVPYAEQLNEYLNTAYEAKKARLLELMEACDWVGIVFTHERPHRAEALNNVMVSMEEPDMWSLVAKVWTDSENIWQNLDLWVNVWSQGGCQMAMTDQELAVYHSLPKVVEVHRGYIPGENDDGLSWTLDLKTAKWFANRFGRGKVITKLVNKRDILAYFSGRGEQEVIILPS